MGDVVVDDDDDDDTDDDVYDPTTTTTTTTKTETNEASRLDAARKDKSWNPNAKNKRGDNAQRDAWADAVRDRNSGGRITKRAWTEHVNRLSDPPALLSDVTVILVGTKKAGNIGAIARACGSFECEDLRVVAPRADPYTRASMSAAKGAQHIVHGKAIQSVCLLLTSVFCSHKIFTPPYVYHIKRLNSYIRALTRIFHR